MSYGDWRDEEMLVFGWRDIGAPEHWQVTTYVGWALAALDKLLTLALPCRCPMCWHYQFRLLQEARGDQA